MKVNYISKILVFVIFMLSFSIYRSEAINAYLDGQFSPAVKGKNLTFFVDPDDANDGSGNSISHGTLVNILQEACDKWNSINKYTGITFSIDDTEVHNGTTDYGTSEEDDDGVNYIHFTARDSTNHVGQAYVNFNVSSEVVGADIEFCKWVGWNATTGNPDYNEWDLLTIAVHELGHCIGLGHCDVKYPHYVMDGVVASKGSVGQRNIQAGDKSGALFCSCQVPTGIIPFSVSLSKDTTISLTSNIYVPSGDSLVIENGVTVDFGNYNIVSTGGKIFLNNNGKYFGIMKSDGEIRGYYHSLSVAISNLEAGDTLYLPNGYTVSSGESFSIPPSTTIRIGCNRNILVQNNGTLTIEDTGVLLNNVPGCSEWLGIEVIDGGILNIDGGLTLRNAKPAFYIKSNNVTFETITNYIDSCGTSSYGTIILEKSPLIRYLYITNSAIDQYEQAVRVQTTNANPSIYNITISVSYYAILVGYA